MIVSAQDHARISAAIAAAETRTSGQIVCVLARSASDYAAAPLLCSAAIALLAPWPLIVFTALPVRALFALQLVVYMVALIVLSVPRLRLTMTPRATRRRFAHRMASEQFVVRRVSQTTERAGVLIFVSLAERYVRILADEGISAKADQADWQAAVDAVSAHMRDGRIADGFIAAIERCGAVLARHAPPDERPHAALPDRLHVI